MNAKTHNIKFNAIMNFLLSASAVIFPLITFPYISRTLLVSGNGRQAFAYSVVQYFMTFAALGIPTYGIRACAQVRDDKEKLSSTFKELFIINIVTTFFTYLVFLILLFTIPRFSQDSLLLIINSAAIFLNTLGVNWLFQALEEYTYITVRNIVFKFLGLALMFLFVHSPRDLYAYAIIFVIGTFGSNILNFIRIFKIISITRKKDSNNRNDFLNSSFHSLHFKRHVKPILIFFSTSAATSVYYSLATTMLGFMSSTNQVGYFDAASRIKNILILVVSALGNVLLPRLSVYAEKHQYKKYYSLIHKSFEFVLITSLSIAIYVSLFAEQIILFLCGPDYLPAVPSLIVLMLALIFIGLSQTTGMQILVPQGKEKQVLISTIIGAALDFICNLIFLQYLGSAGAAIGVAVTELSVLIVQIWYLRQNISSLLHKVPVMRIILSLLPGIVICLIVKYYLVLSSFWMLLCTGVIFYLAFAISLIVFKVDFTTEIISKVKKTLKV